MSIVTLGLNRRFKTGLVPAWAGAVALFWAGVAGAEPPLRNCGGVFTGIPAQSLCREVIDHGLPVDGAGGVPALALYRYEDSWNPTAENLKMLKWISEAALESVRVYRQWGELPPIAFLFTNEIDADHVVAQAEWKKSPCNVTVFFNVDSDPMMFKQVVAHEIFHCFQGKNIGVPSNYFHNHSTSWWVEGTAEYFSNLVYPMANREWGSGREYFAFTTLTEQKSAPSTAIFFQYLETGAGINPVSILKEIKKQPLAHDPRGARSALATFSQLGDILHEFFQAFVDRNIVDTGGGTISGLPRPEFLTIDVPPESPQIGLGVAPHAMNGIQFVASRGLSVKWFLSAADYAAGVRMSYRKLGTTGWMPVSDAFPMIVEGACDALNEDRYQVLLSSSNPDQSPAVSVRQEAFQAPCHCKTPSAALDPCVLGAWKLDPRTTADAIVANLRENEDPEAAFQLESGRYEGLIDFRIALGEAASSERYRSAELVTRYRHRVTGAAKELGFLIDAQIGTTLLQDDRQHLCRRMETASGSFSSRVDDQIETGPIEELFHSRMQTLRYECRSGQLKLWHTLPGRGESPLLVLVR